MANADAAFYRIDDHRYKEAFLNLVESWNGILISDGYGVYKNRVNDRQTCPARLIRDADGLAQRDKPDIRRFGQIIGTRLRELTDFAKAPPDPCRRDHFHRHPLFTLKLYEEDQTDAGKFARRVVRQLNSLRPFRRTRASSRPIPPMAGPKGRCALPCYGASAVSAPAAKRATVGWNASRHSGKPAACAPKPPSPYWWIYFTGTEPDLAWI